LNSDNLKPPSLPASAYRLKTTTELDLRGQINLNLAEELEYLDYGMTNYDPFRQVLRLEFLERFPESREYEQVYKEYALQHPTQTAYAGQGIGKDDFAILFENALNRNQASVQNLEPWLIESEYSILKTEITHNLFGDGKDAWVIQFGYRSPEVGVVYAIRQDLPGTYDVIAVYPWFTTWHSDLSVINVDDVNGDGQAEIAVTDEWWASGSGGGWCQAYFFLLRWDSESEQFYNIANQVNPVEAYSEGLCANNFHFADRQENGARPLQVVERLLANYGPESDDCPEYYERQTVYVWDGRHYIWNSSQDLPVASSVKLNCAIHWAVMADHHNDQAVDILSEALENPDGLSAIDQELGPSGRDYVRFLLATWLDQRGYTELAIRWMQDLHDNPANPEKDYLALLAGQYLKERSSSGLLGACTKVNLSLRDKLSSYNFDGYFAIGGMGYGALTNTLGVELSAWTKNWSTDLCDSSSALIIEATTFQPRGLTDFANWLARNGAAWISVKQVDLNNDEKPDWLALLRTTGNVVWGYPTELWGFVQESGGLKAVFIHEFNVDTSADHSTPIGWLTIQTPGSTQLQYAVLVNGQFFVFRLRNGDQSLSVQPVLLTLGNDAHWSSVGRTKSFTVSERLGLPQIQLTLDTFDWTCLDCPSRETYRWNPDYDRWELSNQDPLPQRKQVEAIETQLFEHNDYARAATAIERLLYRGVSDPVDSWLPPEEKSEYVSTYLRYLLGLAYELSGQTRKAVLAYYRLWRDSPATIFGYLASMRLTQ